MANITKKRKKNFIMHISLSHYKFRMQGEKERKDEQCALCYHANYNSTIVDNNCESLSFQLINDEKAMLRSILSC